MYRDAIDTVECSNAISNEDGPWLISNQIHVCIECQFMTRRIR